MLSLAKAEQMEGTWVVAVGPLLLGSGCLLQPTAFMMVMRVLPHMDSSSFLKMICLSSSMSTRSIQMIIILSHLVPMCLTRLLGGKTYRSNIFFNFEQEKLGD